MHPSVDAKPQKSVMALRLLGGKGTSSLGLMEEYVNMGVMCLQPKPHWNSQHLIPCPKARVCRGLVGSLPPLA